MDTKTLEMQKIHSKSVYLSSISRITRFALIFKRAKLKMAIEECEKDLRKVYSRVKGCVNRKLTSEQEQEIARLENQAKGIAIAAEKFSKMQSTDDSDWDE